MDTETVILPTDEQIQVLKLMLDFLDQTLASLDLPKG